MNSQKLSVQHLAVRAQNIPIIEDVSFDIQAGTITSLIGPSGVGKTTVLRALNRLLEEEPGYDITGTIAYTHPEGHTPLSKYELRRRVGMVFQKPTIFPTSIFNNVIFGRRHVSPLPKSEYGALVEECLKASGLWDETKHRLHQSALALSVGQQQRLAIARTIALRPDVILMDEPTSSLDARATAHIEGLIQSLKTDHAIVLVTHDTNQAKRLSDQLIVLTAGKAGAVARVYGRDEL